MRQRWPVASGRRTSVKGSNVLWMRRSLPSARHCACRGGPHGLGLTAGMSQPFRPSDARPERRSEVTRDGRRRPEPGRLRSSSGGRNHLEGSERRLVSNSRCARCGHPDPSRYSAGQPENPPSPADLVRSPARFAAVPCARESPWADRPAPEDAPRRIDPQQLAGWLAHRVRHSRPATRRV